MSVVNGVVVALPPPKGYHVDFDHPQRQSVTAAYCVSGVGMVLAFLFMAQRIYVKHFIRRNFAFDDCLLVVAWMSSVAIQGLILRGFVEGYFGVHAWEIPLTKFVKFLKFGFYLEPVLYVIPTVLTKLVLLLFYLQLQNQQKWFLGAVYFAIFITVGSNIGVLFSIIFGCNPIRKAWDVTMVGGSCIDRPALYQATAAFGIISDVLIICIPIPMVVRLQMSRAKKAGLLFLFTIGSATVVTSIIRLYLLVTSLGTADQSWAGGPIVMWICIESNLLVICASLPTLRHFVFTIAPTLLSSANKRSENNSASVGPHSNRRGDGLGSSISSRLNGKRHQYHGFDGDTDYRMETLVEGTRSANKNSTWRDPDEGDDRDRDNDSERAIIQTKTMELRFENRAAT
ncbi:hypothetical protein F5884DRAFT_881393 [Xylogone sp. PMI_703]|nr:hypothetical protein F5884DRAFT_881393 [Xylogone sp. PMI_703]